MKNLKGLILGAALFLFSVGSSIAQTYFYEDFESGVIPIEWEQKLETSGVNDNEWTVVTEGWEGEPQSAYEGTYFAFYQYLTSEPYVNKLISPEFDLSKSIKPRLSYGLAMTELLSTDNFKVLCREHPDSAWNTLKEYINPINNWTTEELLIPETLHSNSVQLAFEGVAKGGGGICLDSIIVFETGELPFQVKNIEARQSNIPSAPAGAVRLPIMRMDIDVGGNSGALYLNELTINSKNDFDEVLVPNSLKLFVTQDSIFQLPEQIANSISFENGTATFTNINKLLSFDKNYFWITYDLDANIDYTKHDAILDCSIPVDGVLINSNRYVLSPLDPAGETLLQETIFFDNFDTGDKGWDLGIEFEIGQPQGLGNTKSNVYPDPTMAYSPDNVLGSDLSNDGNYNQRDSAISPTFSAAYYRDLQIHFKKWLNLDYQDPARIFVSKDNGATWDEAWNNKEGNFYWKTQITDISAFLDFTEQGKIQFVIDPSVSSTFAGGWNIDEFAITGDFISTDVGVSDWISPVGGCGLGSNASVVLEVTNYGGAPTPSSIPVEININDGEQIASGILSESIPIGESRQVTVSGLNLSEPSVYENVIAKTALTGDEEPSNNKFYYTLYVDPLNTEPYSTSFETNTYWRRGGINTTWEAALPIGVIIDAPFHGENVWVTEPFAQYANNDSSWVESPCFEYPENAKIILDFALWTQVDDANDGLTIQYSTDNGGSWQHLTTNPTYNKNSYNSANISSMNLPGWTGNTGDWQQVRNVIPTDAGVNGSFKLRFLFTSNDNTVSEGVAIDLFKLYEAPYDVGVTQLASPVSACDLSETESIQVAIENLGISTIPAGTKIPVGLDFKGSHVRVDTLTLAADLAVNNTVPFTFDTTLNLFNAGDYEISVYTKLEDDPFYYQESANDTLTTTVSVTGIPGYDIGDVLGVAAPVDITLDAGAGYSSYLWNPGGATTQTLHVTAAGDYAVTVTNANGCEASDVVTVIDSREEMALTQVVTSVSDACAHATPINFEVELTNNGLDPYSSGETIPVAIKVNDHAPIEETITLTAALSNTPPDNTLTYTFTTAIDLSAADNYQVKIYANIAKDLDHSNDTISLNVNTWGLPDVNLAHDEIFTSQADTVVLDAGTGFATYSWSNGATTQTTSPSNNTSGWYVVTVTDVHACGEDADSTYLNTSDIGIANIVSPVSECEHTNDESLRIQLTNYSGDEVAIGTVIPFSYTLNEGPIQQTQVTLNLAIPANGGTVETTLDQTLDLTETGVYNLKLWHTFTPDANVSQDTITATFETYGNPYVDLPYDTIYTTRPDTVVLDAGSVANHIWQDGYTGQIYNPMKDITYKYYVTVDNGHGCTPASDTTMVITYDLAITALRSPESACVLTEDEEIRFRLKNRGKDILPQGTTLLLGYQLNGSSEVTEEYSLTKDLLPDESLEIKLSQEVDLSIPGTYTLKVFADLKDDAMPGNNHIENFIQHFGNPSVTLTQKQYFSTMADTLEVVAPTGFSWYQWEASTGEHYENDTLKGIENRSKKYNLTVADANGCYAEDFIEVFTHDLGVIAVTAPAETCSYSSTEALSITVKNHGQDTYPAGEEIPLAYRIDGGAWTEETLILSTDLLQNEEQNYTFTQDVDLSANKTFTIESETRYTNEAGPNNDRYTLELDALAPDLELGEAVSTNASSYTIDAGAGFTSYKWFDNSTAQTYTAQLNNQTHNMYYSVTVTNDLGCSWTDSLMVLFNFEADLGVTTIHSPASGCLTEEPVYMHITIMNFGSSTIPASMPIVVGYEHENMTAIEETFSLPAELPQNGTAEYTFSDPVALTNNTSYRFEAYTAYGNDILPDNDRSLKVVDIEDPYVNLGPDELTVEEWPYFLDAGDFETYEWSTGETTQTIEATEPGDYSVTVTDAQGCIATDKIKLKSDNVGISNIIESALFAIYPNPVKETLYIKFKSDEATEYTLVLINMAGEQVYYKNLKRASKDGYQIDVSRYAQGVYYLLIRSDKNYFHQKIIIE